MLKNKNFITEDQLYEMEDKVASYPWQPDENMFICIEDIQKYVEPELPKSLSFLLWLMNKPANTQQEKEVRRYMMNLVSECIKEEE